MDRYNWTHIAEEKLSDTLSRRVIHTEAMTIARIRLAKGAVVPLHSHVSEQVTMLESGRLRFEMGGQEIILHAGDCLVIPAWQSHMVEAMEASAATDVFTPRREDWIKGDDAYLRK